MRVIFLSSIWSDWGSGTWRGRQINIWNAFSTSMNALEFFRRLLWISFVRKVFLRRLKMIVINLEPLCTTRFYLNTVQPKDLKSIRPIEAVFYRKSRFFGGLRHFRMEKNQLKTQWKALNQWKCLQNRRSRAFCQRATSKRVIRVRPIIKIM